jgi:hypothetical protein
LKLLLDEMWSPDIAQQLRRRGHDVVAVVEVPTFRGLHDLPLLIAARDEQRVVVTDNVGDFRRFASEEIEEGRSHAGLILTSNRRLSRHDRRTIGRMVLALAALLSSDADLTNMEHWLA